MILHKPGTLALQGSAGGVSGGYKPGKAAGKKDIFIYERAQNLDLRIWFYQKSGFLHRRLIRKDLLCSMGGKFPCV